MGAKMTISEREQLIQRYYDGEVQTRQIPSGRRHALRLAR